MTRAVNHPRTLALCRAVLFLTAAVGVITLVGFGLSILGATVVVAGLSLLLTGEVNTVGLALLAGVALVVAGGLAALVAFAARWLDRRLTALDRRPDPLDELTASYVEGLIDEATFERRVERLLLGDAAPARRRLERVRRVRAWILRRVRDTARSTPPTRSVQSTHSTHSTREHDEPELP